MPDYKKILTQFYPDLEWKIDGDETVYVNITRLGGTPDPLPLQSTLDAWEPYVTNIDYDPDDEEIGRNETGSTITKGTPVYASGVDGTASQMLIAPCDADDENTFPCIGLVKSDILNSATGVVCRARKMKDLNTSSFSKNDSLYVASGGGLTNSNPGGTKTVQHVARVKKDDATKGEVVLDLWDYIAPSPPGSGGVLQMVYKNITNNFTSSTNIGYNSTPNSSDGVALDSLAITMNGANTVRVQCFLNCDSDNDSGILELMCHRGSTVLAVSALGGKKETGKQMCLDFFDTPGTGTHTYSFRVGCSASGYYNRMRSDSTPYGGTYYRNASNIILTEIG